MQSPIENYCLYVSIDDNPPKKLIPKLSLQVSAREIHNSMVIPPEECVLKKARDKENNIIISYSTLHNILPPQLKNMTS